MTIFFFNIKFECLVMNKFQNLKIIIYLFLSNSLDICQFKYHILLTFVISNVLVSGSSNLVYHHCVNIQKYLKIVISIYIVKQAKKEIIFIDNPKFY